MSTNQDSCYDWIKMKQNITTITIMIIVIGNFSWGGPNPRRCSALKKRSSDQVIRIPLGLGHEKIPPRVGAQDPKEEWPWLASQAHFGLGAPWPRRPHPGDDQSHHRKAQDFLKSTQGGVQAQSSWWYMSRGVLRLSGDVQPRSGLQSQGLRRLGAILTFKETRSRTDLHLVLPYDILLIFQDIILGNQSS